ncbi:MAG: Mur ligase domain-containing protein, partial [Bacteroidales bacterium]|nr:Mur ligase domain-containing protein [Bacteroidales bacterium]
MNIEQVKSVYFVGAGGIGMSNLERYFLTKKMRVAGYDRTKSELTNQLSKEGAELHFKDDVSLVPEYCKNTKETLVVYTPAIPDSHSELTYFRAHGFSVMKRAQVLG